MSDARQKRDFNPIRSIACWIVGHVWRPVVFGFCVRCVRCGRLPE